MQQCAWAEMHHIEAACLYQKSQLEDAEKAVRAAVLLEPTKENYLNTYGIIIAKSYCSGVRSYIWSSSQMTFRMSTITVVTSD